MTDRPDPDDREPVKPPTCSECDLRIVNERPLLGPYGWCHSTCLPDGAPC